MGIRRATPLLLLLAVACGTGTTTSSPDTSPSPSPSPDPTPIQGIETSCETQEGADRDVRMLLHDVEVSDEEGFDRVTFGFEPAEGEDPRVPYWQVAPAEPPLREAGSGREVEVAGEFFWEVTIWASGVDLSGEEFREVYTGPDRIAPEDADLIAEVVKAGDFENTLTFYVGLDEDGCVRVDTGTDPVEIHVDLAPRS